MIHRIILGLVSFLFISLIALAAYHACYAWVDRDWLSVGLAAWAFVVCAFALLATVHIGLREIRFREMLTTPRPKGRGVVKYVMSRLYLLPVAALMVFLLYYSAASAVFEFRHRKANKMSLITNIHEVLTFSTVEDLR